MKGKIKPFLPSPKNSNNYRIYVISYYGDKMYNVYVCVQMCMLECSISYCIFDS